MAVLRQRIREEWNSYLQAVYPQGGLSAEQNKQLRMAFYGGAAAAKHVLLRDLSPGNEPTDADAQILRDMSTELDQFAKDLKARKAMASD